MRNQHKTKSISEAEAFCNDAFRLYFKADHTNVLKYSSGKFVNEDKKTLIYLFYKHSGLFLDINYPAERGQTIDRILDLLFHDLCGRYLNMILDVALSLP